MTMCTLERQVIVVKAFRMGQVEVEADAILHILPHCWIEYGLELHLADLYVLEKVVHKLSLWRHVVVNRIHQTLSHRCPVFAHSLLLCRFATLVAELFTASTSHMTTGFEEVDGASAGVTNLVVEAAVSSSQQLLVLFFGGLAPFLAAMVQMLAAGTSLRKVCVHDMQTTPLQSGHLWRATKKLNASDVTLVPVKWPHTQYTRRYGWVVCSGSSWWYFCNKSLST